MSPSRPAGSPALSFRRMPISLSNGFSLLLAVFTYPITVRVPQVSQFSVFSAAFRTIGMPPEGAFFVKTENPLLPSPLFIDFLPNPVVWLSYII